MMTSASTAIERGNNEIVYFLRNRNEDSCGVIMSLD